MVKDKYKIIVHGGAWDIPSIYHDDHKNGVKEAVLKAIAIYLNRRRISTKKC